MPKPQRNTYPGTGGSCLETVRFQREQIFTLRRTRGRPKWALMQQLSESWKFPTLPIHSSPHPHPHTPAEASAAAPRGRVWEEGKETTRFERILTFWHQFGPFKSQISICKCTCRVTWFSLSDFLLLSRDLAEALRAQRWSPGASRRSLAAPASARGDSMLPQASTLLTALSLSPRIPCGHDHRCPGHRLSYTRDPNLPKILY